MNQKRCLTIQDYSCMGRCSLTVALPILSATGIETVGLPTAILSNHTAFSSWTYVDLTEEMKKSVAKWKDYNHHFDCIYTGYLGTNQIKDVIDIINDLKEKDTLVMVDPAFGDNGHMYPGFEADHVVEMRKLISIADMICPNLTEATLLAGIHYDSETITENDADALARKLSGFGPKIVLLTGIVSKDGKIGCAFYDESKDKTEYYYTECYPGRYHGAGDSYCSAFLGALLNGLSLKNSVKISHDFIHLAMKYDIDNNVDGVMYGLQFEKAIPMLINEIENHKSK